MHDPGDLLKTFRAAGTAIVDAADLRMIEKKHVHIRHILHIDEVAPEFPAAFKQAQLPGLADLVMELVYHRRHLALVILLRAVNVEIA